MIIWFSRRKVTKENPEKTDCQVQEVPMCQFPDLQDLRYVYLFYPGSSFLGTHLCSSWCKIQVFIFYLQYLNYVRSRVLPACHWKAKKVNPENPGILRHLYQVMTNNVYWFFERFLTFSLLTRI